MPDGVAKMSGDRDGDSLTMSRISLMSVDSAFTNSSML